MTKCTGLWHKLDFGKSLDKECHGCTKRLMFKDPLDVEAQKPPLFSDHCPDREPIPTYHNYQLCMWIRWEWPAVSCRWVVGFPTFTGWRGGCACFQPSPEAVEVQSMSCPHKHPLGKEFCTECDNDKARANERQRVLDLINQRLTESASRDVRMALLRLRDDLK